MISRRNFFTSGGLLAAGIATAPHVSRSDEELTTRAGQKPKRIIHIVSDGMSFSTLGLSDLFSLETRQRPLTWMKLMRSEGTINGLMSMRSLNSLVTDSSAASSSWGSGSHVVNGALNVLPDGRALKPLYSLFADKGWARGLVTTAEMTHATPAGFAASTEWRSSAEIISQQYLDAKIDVLLGGGRKFFVASHRKDNHDIEPDYIKAGYTVVHDLAGLNTAPDNTLLLGTFDYEHLPFTIDQMADPKLKATVPTLAEMTTAALVRLEKKGNFILQIEAARVDHAAHNSDAAAAIHDQIALDEAIDVCLEFRKRNPDTLIVVTSDHGNSNPGLNGMGQSYTESSQRFAALSNVTVSLQTVLQRLKKAGKELRIPLFTPDHEDLLGDAAAAANKKAMTGVKIKDPKLTTAAELAHALKIEPRLVRDIIEEATGYRMSMRRATMLSRSLKGENFSSFDQMHPAISQIGQALANYIGIGWTGNTHTSDYVPILAIGPGAERFGGFVQNTEIFKHYTQLAGIDFENPSVPLIADATTPAAGIEDIASYAFPGESHFA